MTTLAVGNRRLLRLAKILEKVPNTKEPDGLPKFYMRRFTHECGTPACAAGWWAFANRRRWDAKNVQLKEGTLGTWGDLMEEFALIRRTDQLGRDEADILFSGNGMGGARTGKQAARFIREFVRKRTAEAA